ncbi:MAG: sigma-70 family RNA polymerase sigma factor [Planctomycetes bacterium]|nr:sigma-70 family RNA polymerase sigma factor [Planctomycetota bacterium]
MDESKQRETAQGLLQGKAEAWRSLYTAYSRRIWHLIARRMGPHSADVADVVQETFLAAARSAASYDPGRGTPWMWLAGIARRHVALHWRKMSRHNRHDETLPSETAGSEEITQWITGRRDRPPDTLETAELRTQVRDALGQLPADYEILLTAKYFDGTTVQQIATHQACSTEAVRSKLARARRAFRRVFAKSATFSADDRAPKPRSSGGMS